MEIPRNFAAEVNKIVLDFIWKQKPAKIKRTALVKTRSDGGLGMKDFGLFDEVLKLTWVKRLCSNSDSPWKYIPNSFLSTVGGTELFQCICNYSYNLLELKGPLLEFYKQIICHWQKIVSTTPHTAKPRYCLRQSGTTNSLRLTKKWCNYLFGTKQV